MQVRVINKSRHPLPTYATKASAGMDLRAHIEDPITLRPFQRALIPTGLSLEIPEGFEAQIRPRSGLAAKNGITVLNTPGTIDADYRGEVKVILINISTENFVIYDGDRIAQMIFAPCTQAEWVQVETLEETDRGSGGFGHTGKK